MLLKNMYSLSTSIEKNNALEKPVYKLGIYEQNKIK